MFRIKCDSCPTLYVNRTYCGAGADDDDTMRWDEVIKEAQTAENQVESTMEMRFLLGSCINVRKVPHTAGVFLMFMSAFIHHVCFTFTHHQTVLCVKLYNDEKERKAAASMVCSGLTVQESWCGPELKTSSLRFCPQRWSELHESTLQIWVQLLGETNSVTREKLNKSCCRWSSLFYICTITLHIICLMMEKRFHI